MLIIGNGGREHALAWKISQEEAIKQVFVAPGNAGTALENGLENIDIGAEDITALLTFAPAYQIRYAVCIGFVESGD